ncbi:JlpA family lipoprotein adhesin [Campylobacter sp. MIT 21-1685]|uniref:JlpA family lipoprotein adhesin n=1 Tax=unclassified Campylobacter TaxID=2593542 RepID=UPI00224B9D03|nr:MULTISPECIES: JlpA family lipoprotein adhesin [unclassified Campylobacter]MCX2683109.1 JlpA family lipoprotein adhesin [Campylobacter sp. MIT 21-1684]MCX2751431.1 JlpA family lipoprotein adhesin [Campylobacter sp. MIT 21-1682]MCX2807631.1 JlpA family lipoprotein adhesin [Campylobacter sp. MIT 21-1685]
MKKNLILIAFIFFNACSNQIDTSLVEKYENQANRNIKEISDQISQEIGLKIEIPPLQCKADGKFIECRSQQFSLFDKKGNKIVQADALILRSNEIYQGKELGTISLKEYFKSISNSNKKFQQTATVQNIRFTQEVLETIKQQNIQLNDKKIQNYIQKLLNDAYTISFEYDGIFDKDIYTYDINTKIHNSNSHINALMKISFKEELFDFFDSKGIRYNTQTLNIDEQNWKEFFQKIENEKSEEVAFIEAAQKNFFINNFSLEALLDADNAFESYILIAKGSLETMKNQSQNEELTLIYDKMLSVLNTINQNSLYKLSLNAQFKNIPVAEYAQEKIKVLEKLTLNGQDFTEDFKNIFTTLFLFSPLKNFD